MSFADTQSIISERTEILPVPVAGSSRFPRGALDVVRGDNTVQQPQINDNIIP